MEKQPQQQFPAVKDKQWTPVTLDMPLPPKVGKKPETITCRNCKSQVQTIVKRKLVQHGPYILWYSIQHVLYNVSIHLLARYER